MATITRRRRTSTPAHTRRTADPFFAVLAARHGVTIPDAPTPARTPTTAPRATQDTRPAQDHLPNLEGHQ